MKRKQRCCAFVFVYADCWFSHAEAYFIKSHTISLLVRNYTHIIGESTVRPVLQKQLHYFDMFLVGRKNQWGGTVTLDTLIGVGFDVAVEERPGILDVTHRRQHRQLLHAKLKSKRTVHYFVLGLCYVYISQIFCSSPSV